jgi:O-antigen/teichoic acid export membrane protein
MNIISSLRAKALQYATKENIIKYLKNIFWLMFEKIIPLAVAFVVGIFVARYFGPANLGLLDYGRSIGIFFVTFAGLNLEPLIVKQLVENDERENDYLGTYLGMRIIASVLVIAAVYAMDVFSVFDDNLTFYIVLFVTGSALAGSFDILKSYFQRHVISQKIALATTSQIVIGSVMRIYFIMHNYSLVYFASVYAVECLILSAALVYSYQRQEGKSVLKWRFRFNIARITFFEWWPMIISGLIIIVYMRVDQVMIKWLLDAKALGYYSSAVRISEIWIFVGTVLCNTFYPKLVEMRGKGYKEYMNGMNALLSIVVVLALIIILPVSLFSTTIMTFLFGEEFAPAGQVLSIHAWSLLFIFLGLVGSRWLINENLQKLTLYYTIGGMVINIFLNIIFIPKYGIQGAAITTLFSQMFASYVGNLIYKRSRRLFYAQTKALFLKSLSTLFIKPK